MNNKNTIIEETIHLGHIEQNVHYSINDKPVVLFLHFSGGNLHMWEGVIPQFIDQYSIVVPDMRGHGKSYKPTTGYHIEDMANDIYLLLNKLEVECCHVVGSSMGAEIGLCFAAKHPEMVLSLVCEGALSNEFGEYGLFDGTEDEICREKEKLRAELDKREERIYERVDDYIEEVKVPLSKEGLWNEYFKLYFQHNLQRMENGKFTYCYMNRVRNEYIQKYWDVKFEEYYRKVQCPVLFLPSEEEGKNERVLHSLTAFTKLLDRYEIQYIDHSVHAYVWMQLPQQAGQLVKSFIDKIS